MTDFALFMALGCLLALGNFWNIDLKCLENRFWKHDLNLHSKVKQSLDCYEFVPMNIKLAFFTFQSTEVWISILNNPKIDSCKKSTISPLRRLTILYVSLLVVTAKDKPCTKFYRTYMPFCLHRTDTKPRWGCDSPANHRRSLLIGGHLSRRRRSKGGTTEDLGTGPVWGGWIRESWRVNGPNFMSNIV